MNPTEFLVLFIDVFRRIIVYSILFRIILSWLQMGQMRQSGDFMARISLFIRDLTDPVINIARKLPHRIGMFDFAPLVALIGIDLLAQGLIILIYSI